MTLHSVRSHSYRLSLLSLALIWTAGTTLNAQGTPKDERDRTLTAGDGWPIHITYYESTRGKESPVVILIPAAEGHENERSRTRKAWDGLATTLNRNGFAVVTVDLRKHGDSVPLDADGNPDPRATKVIATDYARMAGLDLEAVKEFLLAEHQKERLNIRKLGIGAAGSSCLVAAGFAAADWAKLPWPDAPVLALRTPKGQDVRALMMLSPRAVVKGVNTAALMRNVADPNKAIAIHIWHNPSDKKEVAAADKLFRYIKVKDDPNGARANEAGPEDKRYSGEGMLTGKAKPVMENHLKDFFEKFAKEREAPWKTRTSPLQ